jgi:hypothetical protein
MDNPETLDAVEPLAAPTLKWASWPGNNGLTTPQTTMSVGTITGTGTGGQAPGAVAVGDLLIVAATAGLAGGIQDFTISGSGWTQLMHPTAGDDEIKIFVWAKTATSADVTAAGVYTVTFGTSQPEAYSWAEWNFGQNAFVDAWNSIWSNVGTVNGINPACFPTGSADTLLTYWFNYHDATNWVLPGGLTTVFNNTQGGLPSQGASATKVLSAAGFTGNLTATLGVSQQYGAFQLAISTGSPPGGGGGASPIKWLSFQATQPTIATGSSVVVGQDAIAQTLGPFAAGDLYVVAVLVEADTGPPGALSISGTGWTSLVATAAGAPLNTRLSVWGKVVGGGETGIYTVSWPNATGNPHWTAWNYGQATADVANGQVVAQSGTSVVAPSITTTAANETVLAYWFGVDTGGPPGLGILPPTTAGFTPRAINVQGQFKWDMSTGDIAAPTAGATGNLTATSVTSGMPVVAGFQLGIKPAAGGSPPPVPTGLTATAVSSSQINLSWGASTGATGYVVLRGGSSVGTPSGTTFNNTGLTASTSYTYTVEAVGAGGTSAPSSPASATTFASGGGSLFPLFTPFLPPPLIGQGGGPAPTFPPVSPNTAPVPIPPGVLIGPVIPFPTVIAGKALIIFGTGSASSPAITTWFPSFTTTFPAPTFVVSNVWTVPTLSGGVWTTHLPAQTATTPCVPTGGWGSPGPTGSGPGPPSYPTPPGTGLPHHDLNILATQAENDNGDDHPAAEAEGAETPRRRRRKSA